jgi:hypothetical protein
MKVPFLLICSLLIINSASAQELFTEGTSLSDRQFNTDTGTTNSTFVMDFPITHSGVLQTILTWGQNVGSGGIGIIAVESFDAYVLRPLDSTNFMVLYHSGYLTVSNIGTNTFPVTPFNVRPGDFIAHYGLGIPLNNFTGGPATVYFGGNLPAPVVGETVTLPGSSYPLYNDDGRDYAIEAIVRSGPDVPTLTIKQSDGMVTVSWLGSVDTTLLQTTNLAGGVWTTNGTYAISRITNSFSTAILPTGNLFFKLRSP